jgi:hypothetical protein
VFPPAGGATGGPEAPPMATPHDPGRTLRLAGIGTAAAGGLLLFAGLIEANRAQAAANEIDNTAKMHGTFDPAVEKRGQSAERWQTGLLVTGTLAIAAGGGLYYYGRRTGERAAQGVSLTPMASASGAGALLRVTF